MKSSLSGTNLLVAGGTGFVGRILVPRLVEAGASVTVLSRRANMKLNALGIKWIGVDLSNYEATRTKIQGLPKFDSVINLASYVPESSAHDSASHSIDTILSAINLANTVSRAEHFVYVSTCEVYGRPQYLPVDENHPIMPRTFYGLSKFTAEQYLSIVTIRRSIPFAVARLTTLYGPENTRGNAISRFVKCLHAGQAPRVLANGEEMRDYLYVDDAADAVISAVERRATGVFNVASGQPVRVYDVAKLLCEIAGGRFLTEVDAERSPDFVPILCFSIARAREELGFVPRVELREGLRRTWESYQTSKSGTH